jgi:TP901 family phage tail tape measure protein
VASKLYEIAFQIGGKLQASLGKSVTTAGGQLDKLGQQIAQLEKAKGTSDRFRALHNEIDATKLKLRQAEAEMRKLDGEMRATSAPTAQLSRQFADAQAKVAALRTQFRGEVTDLKSVQAAMGAAGMSARTLAADNAKLAANLAKAQAAQQKMRENLGARAANSKNLEAARGGVRGSIGNVLGAIAAASPFALALKVTADFEDSMVRAGALARATDGELATLTDTARKLGRDTRFSATQAATGMQFLAQSGFKTNEIIQAMPGMLNIAAAGAVDLGTAADITSNILRGFGMRADESSRLGDVLTNTFTNSSTNLSMLGDTMKYVGPIAKSLGVSLETTAAAAGLLGTAGIKGEQAGTSMRAMLLRLAAPTSAGKKKLLAAGFDAGDMKQMGAASNALKALKVETTDAKGNLLPLATILSNLSAKTAKFGTAAKAGIMKAIFGMEAATAATVLVGEAGSGNLQKFSTMVARSGTASEIAAKQNATLKGQWDNLKGSVEDLGIQVGYTLMPALKGLVDNMVPVVNNVTTWLQEHPKLTEALVLGSAALITAAVGAAALGLAYNGVKVAALAAKGAMLLMNVATWQAAAAWIAVNAPLLLAVVGIAGLAYAAYKLYEAWNPVSQWFAELWDDALDGVGKYLDSIKTLAKVAKFIPGLSGLAGAVDIIPDIGTNHRAERNRKFNEDALNRQAPYSSLGGPMREDYTAPWSMLDGAGKLAGSGAKRGGDQTVNQTVNITLPPGTHPDVEAAVKRAMASGGDALQNAVKQMFQQQQRLAPE